MRAEPCRTARTPLAACCSQGSAPRKRAPCSPPPPPSLPSPGGGLRGNARRLVAERGRYGRNGRGSALSLALALSLTLALVPSGHVGLRAWAGTPGSNVRRARRSLFRVVENTPTTLRLVQKRVLRLYMSCSLCVLSVYFLRTPSRAPYRTPSACAKRTTYSDPVTVSLKDPSPLLPQHLIPHSQRIIEWSDFISHS